MRTVRIMLTALLALALSMSVFAGVAAAGSAGEDYPPTKPSNQVLDNSVTKPVAKPTTQVLNSSASLPVTGGDVVGLTLLGVGLVGVGVAFTTYRRRAAA